MDEVEAKSKLPLSKEVPQNRGKIGEKRDWCDLCGALMLDLHCKLICRRCGFKRDCSDP